MSASTIAPTPFFSASACLPRKSFCASIRPCAAPKVAAAVLTVSSWVSTRVERVGHADVGDAGDRRRHRREIGDAGRDGAGRERAGELRITDTVIVSAVEPVLTRLMPLYCAEAAIEVIVLASAVTSAVSLVTSASGFWAWTTFSWICFTRSPEPARRRCGRRRPSPRPRSATRRASCRRRRRNSSSRRSTRTSCCPWRLRP